MRKAFISVLFSLVVIPLMVTAQSPSSTATPASADKEKKSTIDTKMFRDKGGVAPPTFIESDSLSVDNAKRIFTYTGNVIVRRGDVTMYADTIDGTYSEKNELRTVLARGKEVRIEKGADLKTHSQAAFYDAVNNLAILSENPSVENKGSLLSADKITVHLDTNKCDAEGMVRVKLTKAESPSPSPTLYLPVFSPSPGASVVPSVGPSPTR